MDGRPGPRSEHGADALVPVRGAELAVFVAGGASMGVGASLHAAVLAPERIEGLVLVLVPAGWSDRPAQAAMYEKMAGIIESRGVARLVELMGDRPPYPFVAGDRPGLTAIVHRHALRWDPEVVPLALRGAAASDLPPPERLAELDVPALVLTWAGDPGHPDTTAARLHEALPRSTLEIARGIGDVRRRWPRLAERFLGER